MTSPLGVAVGLLVCCLYKGVYLQLFKRVSFWLHSCCGEWEGWAVNQVNHTRWVAVVTPTDRPKSVRNRYVIELFCGVVCVVTMPFWHFFSCRGFCHRTESDLFLFLFTYNLIRKIWTIKTDLKVVSYPLIVFYRKFRSVKFKWCYPVSVHCQVSVQNITSNAMDALAYLIIGLSELSMYRYLDISLFL